MKTYRAKSGPFQERPYYSDADIENMCADELRAVSLYPATPNPIRIDRFLEKRFNVVPSYEELGDGILGLTVFGRKGVKAILVSRTLEEEGTPSAKRRVRTTLAHEGGHCLFHAHLFAISSQKQPLFGDFTDPEAPKILCRDEGEVTTTYKGQWWEFQANKAIGALLMPKSLVVAALKDFFVPTGTLGLTAFDERQRDHATRLLVTTFEVNPVVAKIRLNQLFPMSNVTQLSL